MTALAEKIRAANDRRSRLQPKEIWGVTVFLKSWTGKDRVEFLKYVQSIGDARSLTALESFAEICARGLVDEQGDPIFNGDGVDILMEKDFVTVRELAQEILKHNGLGSGAAELAEKNSMSSQSSDSGTSSLLV